MSCTIYPCDTGPYIIMEAEVDITREKSLQWSLDAHLLGQKLGINRYLLDLRRSRNLESDIEGYRAIHGDILRADAIDKSARVAVLVAPGDDSHNFIEVIAQSAGLDVTIFNNLELARRHLENP